MLDPKALTEGYLDKLKAAEREVNRLSRTAEKLRKQQVTQDEKREKLSSELHTTQQAIAALEGERTDMQLEWVEADFSGDAAAKRTIQQRRAELDKELNSHKAQLDNLSESLNALPSLEYESATVAVELESVKTGNAFTFAEQLKQALVKYEADIYSRVHAARQQLPKYSPEVAEQVRMEDEDYREKKQRQIDELERRRARERARQEASKRTYQAATDERGFIVGWHVKDEQENIIGYEQATLTEV